MYGKKHTKEVVEAARIRSTGVIPNAETRKKMGDARRGKKRTFTKEKL